MNLAHIRNFLAVADRGSLRAASRSLGVAQPVISRSIRDLERELGAVLFERSRRGVSLTHIGQSLLARVRAVPQIIAQAQQEIAQLNGMAGGRVAIGLSMGAHVSLLPKALPAFQRRHADVRIELHEGLFPALEQKLRAGEIDFYVGPASEERLGTEYVSEKLHDNSRLVFGRPDHPLAKAASLAELSSAQWVTTSVTISGEAELAPVFEAHGLKAPEIAVATYSAISMIMVTASSDLLALMPRQWREFVHRTGLLVEIPVAEPIAGPAIQIISRGDFPLTPLAQEMADLFRRSALNLTC